LAFWNSSPRKIQNRSGQRTTFVRALLTKDVMPGCTSTDQATADQPSYVPSFFKALPLILWLSFGHLSFLDATHSVAALATPLS